MEDRLRAPGASALPLVALAGLLVITAAWWALALWPTSGAGWVEQVRAVCFGARPDGLPSASGWLLLIGEPAGMFGVLFLVWGRELRHSLATLGRSWAGRTTLATASFGLVAGLAAAAVRVHGAGEPFEIAPAQPAPATLDQPAPPQPAPPQPAPPLSLISQLGAPVSLQQFRGRVVLVGFVYGHCQTLCPVTVHEMLRAARAGSSSPVVLLVTLDPWRDTPARLPSLARAWGLGSDQYLLGGSPPEVEAVLDRWGVTRARDSRTGEIVHSGLVRVVDREGRLRAAAPPDAGAISIALEGAY